MFYTDSSETQQLRQLKFVWDLAEEDLQCSIIQIKLCCIPLCIRTRETFDTKRIETSFYVRKAQ